MVGTTYQTTVKEDVTTVGGTTLVDTIITSTTGSHDADYKYKYASIDNSETASRTSAYSNTAASAADKNAAIQFTNKLAVISPTGYVSRFAPYALILIGGIVLLIIAKKHKKHSEED